MALHEPERFRPRTGQQRSVSTRTVEQLFHSGFASGRQGLPVEATPKWLKNDLVCRGRESGVGRWAGAAMA